MLETKTAFNPLCKERAGYNRNRRLWHNKKKIKKSRVLGVSQEILQQKNRHRRKKKSPFVKRVWYNPYKLFFSSVKYRCHACGKKLWLDYPLGRKKITCPSCGKKFILDVKKEVIG